MTIDIEHALTICHDKKDYIYWVNFVRQKQLLKKICIEYQFTLNFCDSLYAI